MTPALRQALVSADALLRQREASAARIGLEAFAAHNPESSTAPEFHLLLAEACSQAGDPETALRELRAALESRPQWFAAHQLLGVTLADLEQLDAATEALEHALRLRPGHVKSLVNLGAVYRRLGLPTKAADTYRAATVADPNHAMAWRGLAESLQSVDQETPSIAAWHRWAELVPDRAEAMAGLGSAYMRARRWNDAERYLTEAAALPGSDESCDVRLGFVRRERGDIEGALDAYRKGSERSPDALTPRVAAALALPPVYSNCLEVNNWRRRYADGVARLQADLPRLADRPEAVWNLDWTNFYLAYQGENDLALQSAYSDLVTTFTQAAAPEWSDGTHVANAANVASTQRRRLRIGFASSYFRRCTVAAYFESWLTRLDRKRFEVVAFYFGIDVDEVTEKLRGSVDRFVKLSGGARAIAKQIRESQLDVLIYPQLGMDGRDVTLATLRLAPLQCAAWGHPVTTGSSAIDYFFTCADMEPADATDHYREKLLMLPGLGTSYRCPDVRPATREEFGLSTGIPLYVCPQSLFKIHPDNDALFCEVLATDPRGHLVFCAEEGQPITDRFRARIERALSERGLDFHRRVLWQPMRKESDFRALLSVCDVLIDTLHWSGGNTSLDALAAGLPIVTHPGRFLRGRQSAAMLRAIGLPELVATQVSEVPAIATRVANDPVPIRSHIANHRARLFDRSEPVDALATHLLNIVGTAAST